MCILGPCCCHMQGRTTYTCTCGAHQGVLLMASAELLLKKRGWPATGLCTHSGYWAPKCPTCSGEPPDLKPRLAHFRGCF